MTGKPAKIPLSATLKTPFSTPGINSFGIAPPLILLSTSRPLPGSCGSTSNFTFANYGPIVPQPNTAFPQDDSPAKYVIQNMINASKSTFYVELPELQLQSFLGNQNNGKLQSIVSPVLNDIHQQQTCEIPQLHLYKIHHKLIF